MTRLYGSLNNRFDEGKYYNGTFNNLKEGDDITMYYYSDRHCYYITKVVDQKNIFVKKYEVIADHHKEGGMGHQNWLYFKTRKDEQEYVNQCVDEGLLPESMRESIESIKESNPEEWVYRYNKWQLVVRFTPERWQQSLENAKRDVFNPEQNLDKVEALARYYARLNDKEYEKVKNGTTVNKYYDLNGKVSFGIKSYYYDWEF